MDEVRVRGPRAGSPAPFRVRLSAIGASPGAACVHRCIPRRGLCPSMRSGFGFRPSTHRGCGLRPSDNLGFGISPSGDSGCGLCPSRGKKLPQTDTGRTLFSQMDRRRTLHFQTDRSRTLLSQTDASRTLLAQMDTVRTQFPWTDAVRTPFLRMAETRTLVCPLGRAADLPVGIRGRAAADALVQVTACCCSLLAGRGTTVCALSRALPPRHQLPLGHRFAIIDRLHALPRLAAALSMESLGRPACAPAPTACAPMPVLLAPRSACAPAPTAAPRCPSFLRYSARATACSKSRVPRKTSCL